MSPYVCGLTRSAHSGILRLPSFAGFALSKCNLPNSPASRRFVILHFGTAHCLRVHYTTFAFLPLPRNPVNGGRMAAGLPHGRLHDMIRFRHAKFAQKRGLREYGNLHRLFSYFMIYRESCCRSRGGETAILPTGRGGFPNCFEGGIFRLWLSVI